MLKTDPNYIYVFRNIKGSRITLGSSEPSQADKVILGNRTIPEIFKDRNVITARTLAWRLGFRSPEDQRWAAQHQKWIQNGHEARRLLASEQFIANKDVQHSLQQSFRSTYRAYNHGLPFNLKTRERLVELGVDPANWVGERFRRRYLVTQGQLRQVDEPAERGIHQSFYGALVQLLNSSFSRKNVLGPLKNLTGLEHSHDVFDEINARNKYFHEEPHEPPSRKHRIDPQKMYQYLSQIIPKIQRHAEKLHNQREPEDLELINALDDLVAIHRVLAPNDPTATLSDETSKDELKKAKTVEYEIVKSSKDPIHFFTGGNESGVCDSTTEPQNFKTVFTAKNYAIQHADIFRRIKQGNDVRKKRIGQIRYYVGIKDEKPILLINSIDLEAAERSNLNIYRMAIEYSKGFRKVHGFTELWLGRHGDMHLRPFEHLEMFSDLKPAEEQFEILHKFPAEEAFSDFFHEGYEQTRGKAKVYKVAE